MKKRIIVLVALALSAWLALSWAFMWPPVCWPERSTSSRNACINNLRQIDAGKEQWALANHKTNGNDVVVSEVNDYLKNRTTPVCPDGGTYTYNRIGEYPTCSLDGEMVPGRPARIRTSLFRWRPAPYEPQPHRHTGNLKGAIAEP